MESGWYDTVEIPRDIRHSNEIADLEYIHTEIHSHESAISMIDQEIDELMRTVRQLQFKKWEHTEGIRRCKGLITLARRLPYEILANIFELCVRDGFTRTPLVVSHVCSRWRKLRASQASGPMFMWILMAAILVLGRDFGSKEPAIAIYE